MQYDFVAIGDITTDAFIKLKDAEEIEITAHASYVCASATKYR